VTHHRDLLEIERLNHSSEVVGVSVHVVSRPCLAGAAVPTAVVRNNTKTALSEEK
jgi:hypothetical protein